MKPYVGILVILIVTIVGTMIGLELFGEGAGAFFFSATVCGAACFFVFSRLKDK